MLKQATTILLLLAIMPLFAQASIGFKQPKNTTPLQEYRLPTWGYQTWSFTVNSSGNNETHDYNGDINVIGPKTVTNSSSFLDTKFYYLHESEKQTLVMQPSVEVNYEYAYENHTSDFNNSQEGHIKNTDFSPKVYVPIQWNYYMQPKHSIFVDANSSYSYSETRQKGTKTFASETRSSLFRVYSYRLKTGYAFGRIRNVTPVVRALRFNERLQAHNLSSGLTSTQIQDLANYFSQRSGYYSIHERAGKYFWPQVLSICDLENLPLADALYLTEVYSEQLFSSYTGWQVKMGLNWDRNYYMYGSNKDDVATIGPYIEFDWYHNFALDKQLHLNIESTYKLPASGYPYNNDHSFNSIITVIYDWMIADRILWNNALTANFSSTENKFPADAFFNANNFYAYSYTEAYQNNYYKLSSQVKYRIEDKLQLTAYLGYTLRTENAQHDYNQDAPIYYEDNKVEYTSSNFNYALQLTYYLERKMK